ncbi:MobA/MobL family protein [Acinetobacter lwoffii]|uniref:MobA/MobL family protein n=1 Tax=Acinetobacter lwoffii TaxID=28090 RepID=UPI003BF650AC
MVPDCEGQPSNFCQCCKYSIENAGLDERIDHRSYKDQGLDFLEPTHHQGHQATDFADNMTRNKKDRLKNVTLKLCYQELHLKMMQSKPKI